jgi:hypothetical protein
MGDLELDACTFRPETYNADEFLIHRRPSMLGETAQERYERLSCDDQARIAKARTAMHDAYYNQFHYKPQINESSKVKARRKTVDELSSDGAAAQSRARIAAELEAKFRAECTFKPELPQHRAEVATDHAPLLLRPTSEPDSVSHRVQAYLKVVDAPPPPLTTSSFPVFSCFLGAGGATQPTAPSKGVRTVEGLHVCPGRTQVRGEAARRARCRQRAWKVHGIQGACTSFGSGAEGKGSVGVFRQSSQAGWCHGARTVSVVV